MSRRSHAYSDATVEAIIMLGQQIRAERRTLRWTQAQLAERAGMARKTLMEIEQG